METIETVIALLGLTALAHAGGREKEKHDILKLLEGDAPIGYSITATKIERNVHRKRGKGSHYDARRHQSA